ncbi:MAG: hypothetical protein HOJ77_07330 [Flavobacteriales bacterium]|nr:hypothetical protein [Flavobacteriales bacterium]
MRFSLLAGLLVSCALVSAYADTFLGVEVKPTQGTFLVTKDVNVRALPKTASKRLSRLKKGMKVTGAGRPKDAAWLAVRMGDKDLGFVYSPVLIPLIDGAVKGELRGKLDAGNNRACRYSIEFEGKSEASGELFEIADYEVAYACLHKGKMTKFIALMFLIEAPFKVSKALVHQLTIDVQGVGEEVDRAFSTNFLFNTKKKTLAFDGVSLKKFGRAPVLKKKSIDNIQHALKSAVEIAPSSWKESVWESLRKK